MTDTASNTCQETPNGIVSRLTRNLRHNLGDLVLKNLEDPDVLEIMLNPDGRLWIEKFGQGMTCVGYLDSARGALINNLVASSQGTTTTVERPIIEGELPIDGSRFEGFMPPVVSAPSFTIRKKASKIFTLAEYVESGILPPHCLEIIEEAIVCKQNIMVVGGTGSGKTTFVNAIIDGIARLCPSDRLLIIEDTAELQSSSENVVSLKTSDFVNMQRLVMATMRYRPDRILVGEVRDGAALDLLKSWNTGHPGGVATVHANSADGGLKRMERLIAEITEASMKDLIADCVDLIVFLHRTPSGRKISEIASVSYLEETGRYQLSYWLYDKPAIEIATPKREPLLIKTA